MRDLTVVIPVYNESEIIKYVVEDWLFTLNNLMIDFEIIIYNDGSQDDTLNVLRELEIKNKLKIVVVNKANSGHGPTILMGYLDARSEWIFQVDSDNEISPNQFLALWDERSNYQFIIGNRIGREFILSRVIVSFVAKKSVNFLFGNGIDDVNCPFRLFRRDIFAAVLKKIPGDTFAPNVLLSSLALDQSVDIKNIKIKFTPRATGEVSIKKFKLFKQSIRSFIQLFVFKFVSR